MQERQNKVATLAVGIVALCLIVESRACTSIMVGRKASTDGSVMTSHTCDSHDGSPEIFIVPAKTHAAGETLLLTRRTPDNRGPMKRQGRKPTGSIPQVAETFAHIAAEYGIMNEHQLAIGESTFGGREQLHSDRGLIDCDTLTRLMLERAKTAREAIRIGGELVEKYGWCDEGEALTIADTREVWLLEIVGPGKGNVGAIWAAQRVPDDHVSVVANGSRIGQLDLANPDFFMASKNVLSAAEKLGYWSPKSGKPFRFYDAYSPESRTEFATTRREWRVLDLLAPSLKLQPNANDFPFSVKPEKPVTAQRIMELFRDTFEGTDFDMTKNLTVTDDAGKTVKSPLANPFMPYDMNKMLRINGGWGWMGERCIARWFCMYATVTQSREWLPDPVGGLVWLGYSNPAMTAYAPVYAGVTDLPDDYKINGRATGISRQSAWWAYRRVATIAAHRWGDMRKDVAAVRDPLQERFLREQKAVVEKSLELFKHDPAKARAYLTETSCKACREATDAYWKLGDSLWNKYDELW